MHRKQPLHFKYLPADITVSWAEIGHGHEFALLPDEAASIGPCAVTVKRQSGAVRLLARDDLRNRFGQSCAIPRDKKRRPVWPAGIVGSLSHDATTAACAISRQSAYLAIGIDVEPDSPMPEGTALMVPTPTEAARYAPDILQSRLLFCIKEAAYKAFSTLDPRFLDFQDVEVDLDARVCSSKFGLRANIDWARGEKLVAVAYISPT